MIVLYTIKRSLILIDPFSDYNKYFAPNYDTDSNKWIFNVENPIPSTLLKLGALSTIITATDEDTDIAQSAFTITLPQLDDDSNSSFYKSYYTGNYTNNNEINMNEDIYLRTSEESIKFQFDGKSLWLLQFSGI